MSAEEGEEWWLVGPELDGWPVVADDAQGGEAAAVVRFLGRLGEASCGELGADLVVDVPGRDPG